MTKPYRPLKRFSQNFLKNSVLASKIIKAGEIGENDVVLEIGPGPGTLTKFIAESLCRKRIAVEIDSRWVEELKKQFADSFEIIEKNILDCSFRDLSEQTGQRLKIFGNIPYNITSPIILKLIDEYQFIDSAVIMVQKEVANRLTADLNTKAYGILTIYLQAHATVKKLFEISSKNFYPVPAVDSAVLKLSGFHREESISNYRLFKKIIRSAFNNRRKMLRNSLKKTVQENVLEHINSVNLNYRPEQLSLEMFIRLVNQIGDLQENKTGKL